MLGIEAARSGTTFCFMSDRYIPSQIVSRISPDADEWDRVGSSVSMPPFVTPTMRTPPNFASPAEAALRTASAAATATSKLRIQLRVACRGRCRVTRATINGPKAAVYRQDKMLSLAEPKLLRNVVRFAP
jgi:hypothetical protein